MHYSQGKDWCSFFLYVICHNLYGEKEETFAISAGKVEFSLTLRQGAFVLMYGRSIPSNSAREQWLDGSMRA